MRLGTLIGDGTLVAGSILPNEAVLGSRFGVSRTVLREAVKVLASKGLVEVRRKTGTRVKPHAEWNMLDPEVLGWLFVGSKTSDGLTDLLEVRRMIEPSAARMAAERATPDELNKIATAFVKMEESVDDLSSSVEADLEFHLAILEAAHNAFMRPFGALIHTVLRTSFRFTSRDHLSYLRTLKLHGAVLDAIRKSKPKQAEKCMLTVLDQTSRDVQQQFVKGSSQLRGSAKAKHPLHRSL